MEATRKRKSPVPETEEQKRARMDKRNEGDRYRRKAETEEQRMRHSFIHSEQSLLQTLALAEARHL